MRTDLAGRRRPALLPLCRARGFQLGSADVCNNVLHGEEQIPASILHSVCSLIAKYSLVSTETTWWSDSETQNEAFLPSRHQSPSVSTCLKHHNRARFCCPLVMSMAISSRAITMHSISEALRSGWMLHILKQTFPGSRVVSGAGDVLLDCALRNRPVNLIQSLFSY